MSPYFLWLSNIILFCAVISTSSESNNGTEIVMSPCDHANLTRILHDLVQHHSSIASLGSIGNSSQGRELWVMRIGDSVNLRPVLRPQVKLVGNINGFSGPACATLIALVQRLLAGFRRVGSQERRLLQALEIQVLFDMNPDGSAIATPGSCTDGKGRNNGAGVELNRDFPHIFPDDEGEEDHSHSRQPETVAVMGWSLSNNFVLSLSLVSGHGLVVIPFDERLILDDYHHSVLSNQGHPTPDDDIFTRLASKYVDAGGGGSIWNCVSLRRNFTRGWVNGAEWYPARGTMMDWSYVRAATPEVTVGLDCCRNPGDEATLARIAERHARGIYSLLWESSLGGVRGQVIDSFTFDVLEGAMMSRVDRREAVLSLFWFTSPQGEFWRLLPPGTHILQVELEGYRPTRVEIEVGGHGPTLVNIHLTPIHPPTTLTPTTTTTSTTATTITPTTAEVTMASTNKTSTTTMPPSPPKGGKDKGVVVAVVDNVHTFHHGLGLMLVKLSSSSAFSHATIFIQICGILIIGIYTNYLFG